MPGPLICIMTAFICCVLFARNALINSLSILDDLKDRRGYSHLKEEALHRTIWRHRFGGGFGPVVRQNAE